MRFAEKPRNRNQRTKARELLQETVEPEARFNPKLHLTDRDWKSAMMSLLEFAGFLNPEPLISLLYCQHLLDSERTDKELDKPDHTDLRYNIQQLAGSKSHETLTEIQENTDVNRIKSKIYARNLFPSQPLFRATAEDVETLIGSSVGSSAALHALEIEFWKKQSPEVKTEKIPPVFVLNDDYLEEIVAGIKSHLDQTDLEAWSKVISQLVMLRVCSPASFDRIELNEQFWKKTLGHLERLRKGNYTARVIFKYATNLKIIAAGKVGLNKQGSLVLGEKSKPHVQPKPLPVRNLV